MPERKPWFLVLTTADANRPGSDWLRVGTSARHKIVARPIATEGWLVLLGLIALLVAAPLVIWLGGFGGGRLGLVPAIVVTILAVAVIVAGFILIIRARSTRLPG
jgi:hypothetical protein